MEAIRLYVIISKIILIIINILVLVRLQCTRGALSHLYALYLIDSLVHWSSILGHWNMGCSKSFVFVVVICGGYLCAVTRRSCIIDWSLGLPDENYSWY